MKLERINCGTSVTDTLMRAMERAERMRTVVVVYDTTDEYEKESGKSAGVILQDDTTVATINWMIDQAKRWLFSED